MVRLTDQFWDYVEKMNDGSFKCEFCGYIFAPGTSISRIKYHLSGVEGHGVRICTQVASVVQQAAAQALSNKKRKRVLSSSNNIAISYSAPEQINDVEMTQEGQTLSPGGLAWMDSLIGGDIELNDPESGSLGELTFDALETRLTAEQADQLLERNVDNVQNMVAESASPVESGGSPERLIVDADETRGNASQATDLVCQVFGRHCDQICSQSLKDDVLIDDVENLSRRSEQPAVGDSSSQGLEHNAGHSRGGTFATDKLVGEELKKNMNAIWSWLMNDEVSSIGIYGMGGVGKTKLLTHIHNKLLERPDCFPHVCWITVSQDFSIYKLQNLIAKAIQLDLASKDNEMKRAAELSKELTTKLQWVLILDDLWNYFDLRKVGIPIQVKGCKLILTTRSLKVCRGMGCKKEVKMEPLSEEEAWSLFKDKLGHDAALSPKVEQIAKSVTWECAGLPLGIITMAGTMRGVDDIREWRNALEELKDSKVREDDMEPGVFRILRLSYTHLYDSALQKCFLYCALFPEDCKIPRKNLIYYLIDEGIIEGMRSRQAELDKGHEMLNKLEYVCLLERSWNDTYVKMHDLIRDMALQIQQVDSRVMVEAGTQLIELPGMERWTEDLERVSLVGGYVEEIPATYSPSCPNLSTLLLFSNDRLKFIANSFFLQLPGLKVLDLSDTKMEKLPDSISDLTRLGALLLARCENLRHVPSLTKLRALKRLDLSFTALEIVPEGMQSLSNLRYLNLFGSRLKKLPAEILPKLSQMQVLLWMKSGETPALVKGKEVACLKKLETLECHFEHLSDFKNFLVSQDNMRFLSTYCFLVGQVDYFEIGEIYRKSSFPPSSFSKRVCFSNCSISREQEQGFLMFPKDVQELVIVECNDARSLCDVSSFKHATELEYMCILECNGMESLLPSSRFFSAQPPLPFSGTFTGLKSFLCVDCGSIKKLFPLDLLPNLQILEEIVVAGCNKMEEIIVTTEKDSVMDVKSSCCYHSHEFVLPQLKVFELKSLPELKRIFTGKMICNSLQKFRIRHCPKLKRIPLSLPVLENGQPFRPHSLEKIEICSIKWWKSLKWDHPNAKNVLLPIIEVEKLQFRNQLDQVFHVNYCNGCAFKIRRRRTEPLSCNLQVLLRLDLPDVQLMLKAMKTVSRLAGVDTASMDMKEKKLTVTGDMDPESIVSKLKLYHTDILFVGSVKELERRKRKKRQRILRAVGHEAALTTNY